MTIELHHHPEAKLAQAIRVRSHELLADVSPEEGGDDMGPSPHDLYDAALGACKALTLMWYARRKGIPVDDVRTEVTHDATQERQGVYKLTTTLLVSGDLSDAQLAELGTVADKCPVHKLMTKATTEITTTVTRAPR